MEKDVKITPREDNFITSMSAQSTHPPTPLPKLGNRVGNLTSQLCLQLLEKSFPSRPNALPPIRTKVLLRAILSEQHLNSRPCRESVQAHLGEEADSEARHPALSMLGFSVGVSNGVYDSANGPAGAQAGGEDGIPETGDQQSGHDRRLILHEIGMRTLGTVVDVHGLFGCRVGSGHVGAVAIHFGNSDFGLSTIIGRSQALPYSYLLGLKRLVDLFFLVTSIGRMEDIRSRLRLLSKQHS